MPLSSSCRSKLSLDRIGQRRRKHRRLPRPGLAILSLIAAGAPAALAGDTQLTGAPDAGAAGSTMPIDPVPQCLADLKATKVEFRELGAVTKDGCTVEGALELDAIPSPFGTVSAPAKPTLACAFARRFAAWVRNVAAPLTLAYMGSRLAAIDTGPGFVCRDRYNKPGEKISEHAKGDAIDVTAFALENGHRLTVRESSASANIDGVLMTTLRATGCGYFTTILGPGSNDAHKEHFHFDIGLHGASANYRICE
jgi:hypothetical protein